MARSRGLLAVGSLLAALIPLLLLGGCGGGGGAAGSASSGARQGTISLSFPSTSTTSRSSTRTVPPSTSFWRVDVRDPATGQALIQTLVLPISTPSTTVTVRLGMAQVIVAALNADGTVLEERSSLVEVTGSTTASVSLSFAALHLAFLDTPSGTYTMKPLNSFRVGILDESNQVVESAQDAVTVSLAVGPSAGSTVVGTLTAQAVNGIATFTNVRVTRNQGQPVLRLGATSASAGSATSNLFGVSPLPISYLADSPSALADVSGATLLATGDFNGDGNPDAVLGGPEASTLQVCLNNGSGGFTSAGTVSLPAFITALAVADVDQDGHVDIVAAGSSSSAYVFFGRGDGTFPTRQDLAVGQAQGCVLVEDVNQDGLPDIVLGLTLPVAGGPASSGLATFRNQGARSFVASLFVDPNFTGSITHLASVPSQTVTSARDVIASFREGSTGGGLQYYANDGSGTLTPGTGPSLGYHLDFMTAGEVAPHIIRVVGAYASAGELKVYAVNNGVISSTYTGLYMFGETAIPRALSLYDLQGAGKLDIVAAADGANEVQVFPGNGDGTFTWPPQVYSLATSGPTALAVQDVNRDFLPDIVILGSSGDNNALSVLFHEP